MKLAFVSEHANPLAALGGVDAGGQNVHVAALAGGLAARGHDVTVYTRRDTVSAPTRTLSPDGYVVELVPAGPPSDAPKDELLPFMDAFGDHLREQWRTDPVDLVHAHFWMSGLASLRAVKGSGTPLVQTFHALGSVKRRQQGALDTSPPGRVDLERKLCRSVHHVIATCRDEVSELRALGLRDGRASIIPCGVDVEVFRPQAAPPRDRAHLLVIGRIVTRKGIGNVIEALVELPDVELTIAGGPQADALEADPEVVRLRELAERLGVNDRVTFLGAVPREQVPALMCAADIVVSVPWYEPFGIVPVEAMACGRPVVGSAVGGLLDTVVPGTTGELVPPRRPDALAGVLRDLLADPERREAYGRAGRERAVEHYPWDRVVEQTEHVYAEVAAEARPQMGVVR
jgi:glycosyltransferase involved in cell wall biosynthesis